jgi:hypothetical protein
MKKSAEQVDKKLTIEKCYGIQETLASYFSNKYGYKVLREEIFNALFITLSDKYNLE